MPTLKEFVNDVLAQNNLQSDPDQIIKLITDIAKERAVDNVVAISDDEIREMVISSSDLANKLAEERRLKAIRQEQEKAREEERKLAEKEAKEAEKKAQKEAERLQKERDAGTGEQLSLFGE